RYLQCIVPAAIAIALIRARSPCSYDALRNVMQRPVRELAMMTAIGSTANGFAPIGVRPVAYSLLLLQFWRPVAPDDAVWSSEPGSSPTSTAGDRPAPIQSDARLLCRL